MNLVVQEIAQVLTKTPPFVTVLLKGEMGAGKTTLTRLILESLDVTESVNSPTFAIMNEYDSNAGKFFHSDFYRIKDPSELEEMGFDEVLGKEGNCFVEWYERAGERYPFPYPRLYVSISYASELERNIEIEYRAEDNSL